MTAQAFVPYLGRAAGRGLSDAAKVLLFLANDAAAAVPNYYATHTCIGRKQKPRDICPEVFRSNADRLWGDSLPLPAPAEQTQSDKAGCEER
jgi:hypothetical protein